MLDRIDTFVSQFHDTTITQMLNRNFPRPLVYVVSFGIRALIVALGLLVFVGVPVGVWIFSTFGDIALAALIIVSIALLPGMILGGEDVVKGIDKRFPPRKSKDESED